MKVMGLFPIAVSISNIGFLTPSFSSFSTAGARMTRGPLTAYSIFLMQGFVLFVFSKAMVGAILKLLVYKVRDVSNKPCLKFIITRQ